jgi:hypothetical protein
MPLKCAALRIHDSSHMYDKFARLSMDKGQPAESGTALASFDAALA